MVNFLCVASRAVSRAFNVANFWCIGDSTGTETAVLAAESRAQYTVRTAGTWSTLDVQVSANTLNSTGLVVRSRKNTADGNLSVSPGTNTGEFSDLAHSDTVVAGDLYCFKEDTTGASSGASKMNVLSSRFTGTLKKFLANAWAASVFNTGSPTTAFPAIVGGNADTATDGEAGAQMKTELAGTLTNYIANIATNGQTLATTLGARINGGSGNLTVSVPAPAGVGATGVFEDTSNSDTVNVGDLLNCYCTMAAQAGFRSISGESIGADFSANTGQWYLASLHVQGQLTVAAGSTFYFGAGGGPPTASGTESAWQITTNLAFTASQGGCSIFGTNGVTATSTATLRQNGGATALAMSIGSGVSGIVEDLTHTVVIASTDKINWQFTAGGSGTSLKLNGAWLVGTTTQGPRGIITGGRLGGQRTGILTGGRC